ncbi:putative ankyrin repeat protein [Diplonema papillatum]|nr:putative ankyrin repeat protein [Diplonema papillatum]
MGKIDYAKWNNVGDSEDEEEKENNEYRSGVYRSLHRETQLLFDYASAGQPQLVEEVLNKGAFIDGRLPQNGNTALHMSLWLQHADVSRLLIARGANLELKDNDGFRPLHTAAWAAFEGDVAMTKLLLESGALMDQPSNSGCTPLHLAAAANKDIVQILLEGGSNPLVKNSDGKTPREYSIAKGFGATMKRKQVSIFLHSY